ncbi:MAG: transposase, partial [Pseudolabrys sp.]
MKRFIEGEDRRQAILFPDSLEDYVTEANPVRVIDAFFDELDLQALGFTGAVPEVTGRPAYHPATLLKIYLYGYLNRIQSS